MTCLRSGSPNWASTLPRWPRRWRPTSRRCAPATWSTPPGQLPLAAGELTQTGKVGAEVSPEDAKVAARTCALNALAAIDALVGIDAVTRVVKVVGFVASAPGFTGQPGVVNGASEFLGEVFGEAGAHARSAVGVVRTAAGRAGGGRAHRRGRVSDDRRRCVSDIPRTGCCGRSPHDARRSCCATTPGT